MDLDVPSHYDQWIACNEPDEEALRRQRRALFSIQPLISIVTPTYNTPIDFLDAMLRSVVDQTYEIWELCIAEGGAATTRDCGRS